MKAEYPKRKVKKKAYLQRYYVEHKAVYQLRGKLWVGQNREHLREYVREWRAFVVESSHEENLTSITSSLSARAARTAKRTCKCRIADVTNRKGVGAIAYSFQTFSVNAILTSSQMNQVEVRE